MHHIPDSARETLDDLINGFSDVAVLVTDRCRIDPEYRDPLGHPDLVATFIEPTAIQPHCTSSAPTQEPSVVLAGPEPKTGGHVTGFECRQFDADDIVVHPQFERATWDAALDRVRLELDV